MSFNFEYKLNPFAAPKPKQKSGVGALTYPLDGFLHADFDNKFKAKLSNSLIPFTLGDEEPILVYKIWVSAWHEPSKKLIDLPNPVSIKLLFDNNPLQNVTESEAVFLLTEIKKFKQLEGEWTNGLVKPPRPQRPQRNIFDSLINTDLLREEFSRAMSQDDNLIRSIPRDDTWRGGTFQIPVQPAPADPYLEPRIDWRVEAETVERSRRLAVQQEEITRAAARMARPRVQHHVNIDTVVPDYDIDWSRV